MTYLKRRVASHKILRFLQNKKVIFFFQKKSIQSDHWRLLKKKIAKIEGVASLNLKNKRDRKEIEPLILSHLSCQESVTPLLNSLRCGNDTCSLLEAEPSHAFHKVKSSSPGDNKISHPTLSSISRSKGISLKQSEMCLHQMHSPKGDHINVKLHSNNQDQLKMVGRICDLLYGPNLILGSDSLKKLADLSNQLRKDSNLIFTGGWDGKQLINHLDSLKLLETPQDIWKDGISCLSSCYASPYFFLNSLLEKRKNLLVHSLKERMHALVRSLQERKAQQAKQEDSSQEK